MRRQQEVERDRQAEEQDHGEEAHQQRRHLHVGAGEDAHRRVVDGRVGGHEVAALGLDRDVGLANRASWQAALSSGWPL